jgi:hypothetical protein
VAFGACLNEETMTSSKSYLTLLAAARPNHRPTALAFACVRLGYPQLIKKPEPGFTTLN